MAANPPSSVFLSCLALLENPCITIDNAQSAIYDTLISCTPPFDENSQLVCSLRIHSESRVRAGLYEIVAKVAADISIWARRSLTDV
jgi:hypothetical protein